MEPSEKNDVNQEPVPSNHNMSAWHWLVVIGTALGTVLCGLVPHSFGTFIAYFKSEFNNTNNPSFFYATQFQLDWLPAFSSAFPCIFLPFFAFIVHRLNRSYQMLSIAAFALLSISCGCSSFVNSWAWLFLTYSFLYSLGSSIFSAITIIILAEYFPVDHRYHILATSLFQIGYPTASLIGNPVISVILVFYGWQAALKFLSLVIVIFGVAISCLMKPIREKGFCKFNEEKHEDPSPKSHNVDLMDASPKSISTTSLHYLITTYEIWPWLIGKFINYMCWYGLRTNIMTYLVKSTKFGLTKSAILMATYASAEIAVAFIASIFGERFRGFLIHVHFVSAIAMATLTGVYTLVITSYFSAIIVMICVGISVQFSLTFGYPTSVEVLKSKFDMKTGWIFTNVAAGLGILSSPFCSGILMDYFGVHTLLYSQCVGWTLQALLFLLTSVLMKRNENRSQDGYEDINMTK